MSRKRSLMWFGMAFLLAAICLAPFGGAQAAEKTEILVGAINSLTGTNAMSAAECKWAYEQAINDVNAKGGVFVKEINKKLPVKLIFSDDKSSSDGASAAMERLIKVNKVDLALSSNITPYNLAAATVCEKYRMFYSIATSWIDEIEKRHFRYVSDMFSSASEAARTPFLVWESWPKEKRPQRPVLLMLDTPDGQAFGAGFRRFAKEYGYTFVVDEPYQTGSKDFSALVLKWQAANADALLTVGGPVDAITVLRQMKDQNFRIPYVHGWGGFWPREFERGMGKDANYTIHDGFWSAKNGAPMSEELEKRFKKDHNGLDSVSVGLSYANAEILCKAIEKAGSFKADKVRDAIFGGEFQSSTMGDAKFNEKGLAFKPLIAMQWWNGERMPLYPPNTKVWTYKAAPSTW